MSMISEFVEEIKAKINHKKEYHKNFYEKLGQNLNDNDLHKATQIAFDDCMEFINELAEKYRDVPDANVGKWIPVSERLPEVSGEYYTYVYYDGHYMYSIDEIDCDGMIKNWNCASDYQVIAWKPIAPYQPKGE